VLDLSLFSTDGVNSFEHLYIFGGSRRITKFENPWFAVKKLLDHIAVE
jgi:hypothetical protein